MKFKVVPAYKKLNLKGKDRLNALAELSNERAQRWSERESRLAMIQALIPLGLKSIEDELLLEVEQLTGSRYHHGERTYTRWGSNPGSVYVGGQKLGVRVPRVRNVQKNSEVQLKSYEELQSPKKIEELVYRQVINGIAARKYEKAASLIPETFGIKKSAVSNRFIEASKQSLKQLMERDLSSQDIVAIFIDGKHFADNEIVMALGVNMNGDKIVLGFIETATENHGVCKDFIEDLISRGLRIENEILFVVDGAKGLRKGIKEALGNKAQIQRCQWHKRENILGYLPESEKDRFKKKLKNAYNMATEELALKQLKAIGAELKLINESAYASLLEGLEETVTVHRFKVPAILRKTLATTNPIENLNSLVGPYTDRVDHWKNSNQRQRWVAVGS